jgi:hypothetical protein
MNELAISQPVMLQDLKPEFGAVTRQSPGSTIPFLRFQIGVWTSRVEMEAVYDGGHLVGERASKKTVRIFKLIGFGETLDVAQAMASKKGVKL